MKRFAFIATIWLITTPPSFGQVEPTGMDPLAAGKEAFEEKRLDQAEYLLTAATTSPESAGYAHYYLARLYLDEPFRNPGEAFRQLRLARELDPDNPDFIRERIRQLRSEAGFFGTRASRANERRRLGRLLAESSIDSIAAIGHVEIGIFEAGQFERYRFGRTPTLQRWSAEAYDAAVVAFQETIRLAPDRPMAYREILKLYIRRRDTSAALDITQEMRSALPNEAEPWLLRGLVLMIDGDYEASATQMERAFSMMTDSEFAQFDAVRFLFLGSERQDMLDASSTEREAVWIGEDPRQMSTINERQVSHYGRMVYADLFFPKWRDAPGDDKFITPGDVILRYGIPLGVYWQPRDMDWDGDLVAASLTLRYNHYFYRFEDPFSTEDWRIPSGMGPEDPVTAALNSFKNLPDADDEPAKPSFAMPYLVSRFPGAGSATDLLVTYGIPVKPPFPGEDVPLSIETGVFLVNQDGARLDAQQNSHAALNRLQIRTEDSLSIWTDISTLSVGPGSYSVHVEAESENLVSYSSSTVTVDSDWSGFSVSDPLLAHGVEESGEETAPGELSRKGFLIRPAASRSFSIGTPVHLYYEVNNLRQDSLGAYAYQVTVALDPVDEERGVFGRLADLFDRADPAAVAASFTSNVNASDDATYQILDLSGFEAGTYRIALQVLDLASDQVALSEQVMVLH